MASPSVLTLLLGALVLLLYLLYRSLIPTPIPGIPYTLSAIRPFGDAVALAKYQAETGSMIGFFTNKCYELQSPIVQMFVEPFKKPWVVIADSITAEDILTRRTNEFDVSPWFTGIFEATIPGSHLHLHTNEQWRRQRKAVNDIMSAQFLHNVASSRAYASCLETINLWAEKVRLGGDRPFSVATDVEHMLLDTIWAIAFGSSIGSTRVQNTLLTSLKSLPHDSAAQSSSVVIFPEAPRPSEYNTLVTIADSHLIPLRSPFGPLHHKFALRVYPKLRKAVRNKEKMINERLDAALKNATTDKPKEVTCAADLLVQRERTLADKEGRRPLYNTAIIRDELYTFLQAGNDTTATTLQWGLKYLTAYQDVQNRLRTVLHQEYGFENIPTALQIARTHVPYLEATVEEIFRCGSTAGILARETQVDCQILGCHVPAKTNVLMACCGPSYRSPPISSAGTLLGKATSQGHTKPLATPFTGNWNPDSLSKFQPERWLTSDQEGQTRFAIHAGPSHGMGTGPRHCFGKPMAKLVLRVFLTLILLKFELQTLPKELEEFKAVQRLTHRPRNVYLRLRRLH